MYAASREALAATRSALQAALSASATGSAAAAAANVGSELFSVVEVLDAQRALRGALADASTPAASRQALADRVFGDRVSPATAAVVRAAAGGDWSTQADLGNSLVQLGREALLTAAQDQGQLDLVEDELFRLGRIVAGSPELEQALSDRGTSVQTKRELLSRLLYGKCTAVTEALALQAVGRLRGAPADAFDELSQLAAERRNSAVAEVTSSAPLSAAQVERLASTLTRMYGQAMTVHVEVDPDLLSGLVVRVGDEVIDGSAAGRLAAVRKNLS